MTSKLHEMKQYARQLDSLKATPVTICLWIHHSKFQVSMPVISVVLTKPHMPAL